MPEAGDEDSGEGGAEPVEGASGEDGESPAMEGGESEATGPSAGKPKLSAVELGSLAGVVILLLAGGFFLWNSLHSNLKERDSTEPAERVKLPIKAKTATIESIKTYWQRTAETARVRPGVSIVPGIEFEVEPGADGARLMVTFQDQDGRTRGDLYTEQEKSASRRRIVFQCTDGLATEFQLHGLRAEGTDRWRVKIHEHAGDAWSEIAHFYVSFARKQPEG